MTEKDVINKRKDIMQGKETRFVKRKIKINAGSIYKLVELNG